MLHPSILLMIAITCSSICSAFADCPIPLEKFGEHAQPPAPYHPPPVDNTYGHFSFGSDIWIDPDTHSYFAWNFIKNEDAQGLAISWERPGLTRLQRQSPLVTILVPSTLLQNNHRTSTLRIIWTMTPQSSTAQLPKNKKHGSIASLTKTQRTEGLPRRLAGPETRELKTG
jgi:hypothetical protein